MPEDIYKQDRFYIRLDTEEIIWMYHNPDAISGDQFVTNIFDMDLLNEALGKKGIGPDTDFEPTDVFDFIGGECRQYCTDYGDYSYDIAKEKFESEPDAIGLTNGTVEKIQLMFQARDLINAYCKEEFDHPADFSDLRKIGIGYTTTDNEEHEIQVYANLIDHKTVFCYDNDVVAEQESKSLAEYVEKLLPYLDFNELIDIPDWVIEDHLSAKQKSAPDIQYLQFSSWGHDYNLCIGVDSYCFGGGIALEAYSVTDNDIEPFSNITVNLPDYPTERDCAFVDTNNFGDVEALIQKYKLGKPTGRIGCSGYCTYPEYRFDMAEVNKYRLPEEPEQPSPHSCDVR